MIIAPDLLRAFPELNNAQRDIIGHGDGPLLVIAGPGSGKTFSLVLRALNLLLLGKCKAKELILCTFTEKAAFELRDRISSAAQKIGYSGDLSELTVSTIHGLCNQLITLYRHKTLLGNNYETLDELTQLLFIFEHFDEIIGSETESGYLGHWKTKWTAIKGVREYFDKITEELINPDQLLNGDTAFIQDIGNAYIAYEQALLDANRVDFAHLQKFAFQLLTDEHIAVTITKKIKYVLVDEYQDTNYVQEQLLLKLTQNTNNLTVVGDEDQSLYRFRGATVRNILEFSRIFPDCKTVQLTTNYRSHPKIIEAYDRWMASADWSNPNGLPFRHQKTIQPDPEGNAPEYPAIFSICGVDEKDEANRVADLVEFLKTNDVIKDYNQVALLLHSVRIEHSEHYLKALESKGIPVFCPRARAYFENDEVRFIVACFAIIFGWYGEQRGTLAGPLADLAQYVDESIVELAKQYANPSKPLGNALASYIEQIESLQPHMSLDIRPADYFYQLLALEPFASFIRNENQARNLAMMSQLITMFQNYYHYTVITYRNRFYIRLHLFCSFIRLLYEGGINEYEDPNTPFPEGYMQVMTIHQSKGLEFTVVIVGSLDKQLSSPKQVDRELQRYYHRPLFEPESRITLFDRMRLHYVAFSRAEKILALTSTEQPKSHFNPIWQTLLQWPYVKKDLLASLSVEPKRRTPVKKTFSFTSDLKVYETCPRQYQFFRDYQFTPSRSAEMFFGSLVHQTIEDIHRLVLDKCAHELNEERIKSFFDFNYVNLVRAGMRIIGEELRGIAFSQVMDYYTQNKNDMDRILETEVDVSVEKEGYILTGKIDLLLGSDNKLELLDFKSQTRPRINDPRLDGYYKQLCIYAHILERRYGKHAERLFLYWTGEPKRQNALMEFPFYTNVVDEAGHYFDRVVEQIRAKDYAIRTPPELKICHSCDLRSLCNSEGAIA